MKRQAVLIIASVMLLGMFGGFLAPEKGYAQGTSETRNLPVSELLKIGQQIFRDAINAVSASDSFEKSEIRGAVMDLIVEAQTIFTNKFKDSGAIPDNQARFEASLQAASTHITNNTQKALSPFGMSLGAQYARRYLTSLTNTTLAQGTAQKHIDMLVAKGVSVDEAKKTADSNLALKSAEAKTNSNATVDINGDDGSQCTFRTWTITGCLSQVIAYFIKTVFLNIAGFLLWLSANMLNYSIQVGILDFKSWAPDTLYPIWIIVRQIVSLFVVFAGLWLGLMYIIGKDETFEKYIPWVVIFALFVNFSYPIVRTAVDISNVVSLNIYASAVGNDALTGAGNNTPGSLIMSRLGLQDLVMSATKTGGSNKDASNLVTGINSPAGALMAVAFVLYAAYIFFMVTALIIMRTVTLIFLIIASPILFVDSVIPKLGDEAVKLRKILFEQLAVGPVFMIMLALTLKFLGVFNLASGSVGIGGTSGVGGSQTIKEFFNIAMMLIMLHVMLKVTKSTAGSIGQMATNAMGKVGGFAGGMAMGGVGMLGRAGIGRAAAGLRDSKWMTNRQGGLVGRHMYNMTDSVAKSSFDARNSSYVQSGASKLGMGVGKGMGMGYEELQEARNKNLAKHLGRIGTHSKDVYDDDGGRIHKKGEVNTSAEATAAVGRYTENAGGAIFGRKDAKGVIKSESKQQERTKGDEELSKYRKIDEEYEKDVAITMKDEFKKKANPEVLKKLEAFDKKVEEEKIKKEEQKRIAEETLTATKAQAVATQNVADAMKSQQAGTQAQSPIGYTPPREVAMTTAAEKMKNDSTSTPQSNKHDINAPLEFA